MLRDGAPHPARGNPASADGEDGASWPPDQYLNDRFVCDREMIVCVDLCVQRLKQVCTLPTKHSSMHGVYGLLMVLVELGAIVVGTAGLAHTLHNVVLRSVSLAVSEPRRPPVSVTHLLQIVEVLS